MKILLIYPYWLEKRADIQDVIVPPIGMYYVGSVLKEHHYDVEILNWSRINETPENIEKVLLEKKPDIEFKAFNPNTIISEVLVELKAIQIITKAEETQVLNYLKVTGLQVGLLINFGQSSLKYKRLVQG